MKYRLAICAIPFGFGPASKAAMIVRGLNELEDIEWVDLSKGIAAEYLMREKVATSDYSPLANYSDLDGAVVVMDNDWAQELVGKVPVFFVDSLGYMWSDQDFDNYPKLRQVEAYFTQDLFGAYENMCKTGVANVVKTPPIVERGDFEVIRGGFDVVHLGGLLNPINPETSEVYLKGILEILGDCELTDPVFLVSEIALNRFSEQTAPHNFQSVGHNKALELFSSANTVISSTGLTTILEASRLGKEYLPLPPQNYSQVLNMQNVFDSFSHELHPIWAFLYREYKQISPSLPEEEGVRLITELNKEKLSNREFQADYIELLKDGLVQKVRPPFPANELDDGVSFICRHLLKKLGDKVIVDL